MKIIYALISIISFFSVSNTEQNKKAYALIVLNDKYNQIQKDNSKVIPQNYELKSLHGLILDCTGYDFTLVKTMNKNKLPDRVHIISKAGTFTVKHNTKGHTIIDGSTMQSLNEKNKFF